MDELVWREVTTHEGRRVQQDLYNVMDDAGYTYEQIGDMLREVEDAAREGVVGDSAEGE
jgi:hypothetical protein